MLKKFFCDFWQKFKSRKVTYYIGLGIYVIAFIIAIVGCALLYKADSTVGYQMLDGETSKLCSVFVILLLCAGIISYLFLGEHFPVTVCLNLIALVLATVSVGLLVLNRAELAASLTSFDSQNQLGWSVLYASIAAGVVIVVDIVLIIVGAFFGGGERKKKSDPVEPALAIETE